MPTLTCFPLGNADTTRIDLADGRSLLVDFADVRAGYDLAGTLRADLKKRGREGYDAVAFTHFDRDHICGASDFFHLDWAETYQGEGRVKIKTLWVPAAAILETGNSGDSRALRQEARYRLKQNYGVRVFSSPGLLNDWLKGAGIDPATRRHLFVDAGTLVPDFTRATDGVEFFAHSPFATRSEQGAVINRNKDCLAFQATFEVGGRATRVHFFADLTANEIAQIVDVTEWHGRHTDATRYDRLRWDVFHLPHHSSYLSLHPTDRGATKTTPLPSVARLYEDYGQPGAILISTSRPVQTYTDNDPPHEEAARYYRDVAEGHGDRANYVVTMEHPSVRAPAPLVVQIDDSGASVVKPVPSGWGAGIVVGAPRPSSSVIDHG